ncbi:MAG: hypothetical protein MZV65_01060 [Chromatiales bacterium]|nr:hypothetical protein [Chromatiales bacterium]
MSSPDPQRSSAIRAALHDHLARRLNEALSKIDGTDSKAVSECKKQQEFYQLQPLLQKRSRLRQSDSNGDPHRQGDSPRSQSQEATNLNR